MPDAANPIDLLKAGFANAEALLKDTERCEELLQRMEHKLSLIPAVGEEVSKLPVLASLLRSYLCKEYTVVPVGTLIAIVSAILYFVSPVDLIPDTLPGAGYVDDAAVIIACCKMIGDDIAEYDEWRRATGRIVA